MVDFGRNCAIFHFRMCREKQCKLCEKSLTCSMGIKTSSKCSFKLGGVTGQWMFLEKFLFCLVLKYFNTFRLQNDTVPATYLCTTSENVQKKKSNKLTCYCSSIKED